MLAERTSIEIPDALLRPTESAAAQWGIPPRARVTEALSGRLPPGGGDKPWMKSCGKLRSLRKETARINRIIEEAFGRIGTRL